MENKKLTKDDVEEIVNQFATKYAKEAHGLPDTAVRIILWPTDKWVSCTVAGPTAIIKMGLKLDHPVFNEAMRRAIDHVAIRHLYQRMEIEKVADIVRRSEELRRIQRVRYNFDSELVPHMLKEHEVAVRRFQRVEVVHRATGKREVVEYETGHGNIFTMTEVAKARLSRRILEDRVAEVNPFDLSSDDPNWIARTA
jgi:hypothetical protein